MLGYLGFCYYRILDYINCFKSTFHEFRMSKKQIVFIESFPEIMTYKMARIFKKKGYETVSIRLLKSKGLSEEFYEKAYDKKICFNLDFHKMRLKNIPSIFLSFMYGLKDFVTAINKIKKLKPYFVVGRSYPSWPIALARYIYKGPMIYFPYDILTIVYIQHENSKKLNEIKDFELKAEKYCFKNADGILHKGGSEEINFLEEKIYKEKIICENRINFNPYCSREFIVPINLDNKLSSKDNEIHTVYIGASGSTDPKGSCDFLFDYFNLMVKQNIHVHLYIKPNTLSEKEIVRLYKNALGDLYNSEYFHLHFPLDPKEIIKEISKYDFGLSFSVHMGSEGFNETNTKFTTGNKFASYFEAGLPVIYSSSFGFMDEVLTKYGLGMPVDGLDDIKNIKERINKLDYKKVVEKVVKAREDFLMEKNFPRLERFIEDIVKSKKG